MSTTQSSEPAVLTARTVRGRADVLALGADWDDLMSRADGAVPFLARAWVEPWIERAAGTPVAITAWAGGRLVGLFALSIRSRAGVRVAVHAATGSPGYFGLLLDPSHPAAAAVLAELCAKERVFHALAIEDFSSADAATTAFLDELTRRGFRVAREHRNPCRSITLGCTYDEYLLATKLKKSRANLRREEKKLRESGDVQLVHLVGAEVTADALRRAAVVQDASWMKGRGAAILQEPFYQRLTLSAAAAGMAHLWLVTVNGEDAAFVYGLVSHGQLHYTWTAFRLAYEPLSVGKVLTSWTIRDACAAGMRTFDFGQGDGEYKRFWATDQHDVHRVVAGRGPGAVVVAWRRLLWRMARISWVKTKYRALRRYLRERRAPAPAPSEAPADTEPAAPA